MSACRLPAGGYTLCPRRYIAPSKKLYIFISALLMHFGAATGFAPVFYDSNQQPPGKFVAEIESKCSDSHHVTCNRNQQRPPKTGIVNKNTQIKI
jgi:hypothetical protein